MDQADAC
ncbi:hypothetical protein VCHC50A2_1512A, partial [Vibrio cholerae HC-50A2]